VARERKKLLVGEECQKRVTHGSLDLGRWAGGGEYKEIYTGKSPITHHLGPFLILHNDLVLMRKVLSVVYATVGIPLKQLRRP